MTETKPRIAGAPVTNCGWPALGVVPRWLRRNPIPGRLLIKLAVVLPLGLAAGLLLAWVCVVLEVSQNFAAAGAAVAALWAGMRLANRLAAWLGLAAPET